METVIWSSPALYAATVEDDKKVQEIKDNLLVRQVKAGLER